MSERTRVMLIDDHEMARRGLRAMLSAADWIEVVSAKDLAFRSKAAKAPLHVKPMFQVTDEKYAVYWGMETKA